MWLCWRVPPIAPPPSIKPTSNYLLLLGYGEGGSEEVWRGPGRSIPVRGSCELRQTPSHLTALEASRLQMGWKGSLLETAVSPTPDKECERDSGRRGTHPKPLGKYQGQKRASGALDIWGSFLSDNMGRSCKQLQPGNTCPRPFTGIIRNKVLPFPLSLFSW